MYAAVKGWYRILISDVILMKHAICMPVWFEPKLAMMSTRCCSCVADIYIRLLVKDNIIAGISYLTVLILFSQDDTNDTQHDNPHS